MSEPIFGHKTITPQMTINGTVVLFVRFCWHDRYSLLLVVVSSGDNCPFYLTSFLLCNYTPKYLSQPFLFGCKIIMPQMRTTRDAIFLVHFRCHCFFYCESNCIDWSDDNNNNNSIIPSSIDMSGLSNRIVLFVLLIITALLLIHYSFRFLLSFCYGRYSRDQQPRRHLDLWTCYITHFFLIEFDMIRVTITCCEA